MKSILITGGAGFIGNHVVRQFVKKYPNYTIVNLDKLTYAGNLETLSDIEKSDNYHFVKACITDELAMHDIFAKYHITDVIHLAAESHVDRSITDPLVFLRTNILGTANLLNAAKTSWEDYSKHTFYHISTDEVYGSLGDSGLFKETTPYDPRSPYSASKASSDHLVRAYHHTYGMQIKISNCSNNYGPYQFPEKLIPLIINNIVQEKALPVYGDGSNVRDWLYVQDHVEAIDLIFHKGQNGETYNIGGNNEMQNLALVHILCESVDRILGRPQGEAKSRITFVKDRPGHDQRYAIDASKIKKELNWEPVTNVGTGVEKTVQWYLNNKVWLENVTSGAYKTYYEKHYGT